ncbi:hypothetical protein [Adhaeretor mobilis]|uniref:Uncharacterized protein n=1 Tax=Adhaeretor mobilis TaxID=1930276 RepID=A0A517MRH4_9BACT|nr:hypothetical protein [Adhaeretor mobilis]QDS97475.1 hypothetical protein HG15A2_07360 [Adhaeretor mobilis]
MALLRLLLLLVSLIPSYCCAQGVPLCPSILLFYKEHHRSGIEQLQKAAQLGFEQVNLVVTLRCEIDNEGRVLSYGRVRHGKYRPLTNFSLTAFRRELLATCREAKRLDLRLSILPHLDAAGEIYEWRNHFDFDPLQFYQGQSYDQAMLQSIASALNGSGYGEQEVYFALSGEMGRSLFIYPDSYAAILKQLRTDPRLTGIRWGISLNFSEVAGEAKATAESGPAVQRVIDQCDFLGLSHYRPFKLPARPEHFAISAEGFLAELAEHQVEFPESLELHFSEIALGGGGADSPVAKTPSDAAATPWEGSADPRKNPWDTPEMRTLRVGFHNALLEYLADPATHHATLKNPVTAAYLWNEGSWDPMDLAEDGFADEEITATIQQHNEQVEESATDRR